MLTHSHGGATVAGGNMLRQWRTFPRISWQPKKLSPRNLTGTFSSWILYKNAKLETNWVWPRSRDLLLFNGTPSISHEWLKLNTWNLVCRKIQKCKTRGQKGRGRDFGTLSIGCNHVPLSFLSLAYVRQGVYFWAYGTPGYRFSAFSYVRLPIFGIILG